MRGRAGRPRRILVVGPDGCGKSTISSALVVGLREGGSVVAHLHYRPGRIPPRVSLSTTSTPQARPPHGILASVLKLLVTWLDYMTWHARCRGDAVIERGWYDQAVDLDRYRIAPRARKLIYLLGATLPRADLGVLLAGDAEKLAERKQELTAVETRRQVDAWSANLCRAARQHVVFDTTTTTVEEVLREVRARMTLLS